jgi:hypothetical protein
MIDLSSYVEKPMDNGSKAVFYRLIKEYNQLQTQEKFSNIMLYGWILLESYTNKLFLEEHGIAALLREGEDTEKRQRLIDTLEKVRFETKIQFLKKNRVIRPAEYKAINTFQIGRNRLFHASHNNDVFKTFMMRNEQEELIKTSKVAFDAIYDAVFRYYDIK